jgi:omega-hydroxy-beta-dihydromenaquinone-9 sulfotransferase
LTDGERTAWKRAFLNFVRTLSSRDPRRLVLKSPTHTARIPTLLELFPDAKFVHITRDPYVLFSSTVKLWTSMAKKHGFQAPRRPDFIREKVLTEFRIIVERYLTDRSLIPTGRLVELRYESLIQDPIAGMRSVYEELSLGGWDNVHPAIEGYFANQKDYETNKYQLSDSDRQLVQDRWGDLIDQMGY